MSTPRSLVIHISGPSGAGKTTLGNKLQEVFGSAIVVKDTDELILNDFVNSHYDGKRPKKVDKERLQAFIDSFVAQQTKPLILVGLTNYPWWDEKVYYNTRAQPDHKFYIKISDGELMKQKCRRFINMLADAMKVEGRVMRELVNDNPKFLKEWKGELARECNMKTQTKLTTKWAKAYKRMGYKFLDRDQIFNEVVEVIKNATGQ